MTPEVRVFGLSDMLSFERLRKTTKRRYSYYYANIEKSSVIEFVDAEMEIDLVIGESEDLSSTKMTTQKFAFREVMG